MLWRQAAGQILLGLRSGHQMVNVVFTNTLHLESAAIQLLLFVEGDGF